MWTHLREMKARFVLSKVETFSTIGFPSSFRLQPSRSPLSSKAIGILAMKPKFVAVAAARSRGKRNGRIPGRHEEVGTISNKPSWDLKAEMFCSCRCCRQNRGNHDGPCPVLKAVLCTLLVSHIDKAQQQNLKLNKSIIDDRLFTNHWQMVAEGDHVMENQFGVLLKKIFSRSIPTYISGLLVSG